MTGLVRHTSAGSGPYGTRTNDPTKAATEKRSCGPPSMVTAVSPRIERARSGQGRSLSEQGAPAENSGVVEGGFVV